MYSVVLMAALSTGVSAPECHFGHGCCGCYGGYSDCGCYGGYGCYGGCTGCYGGYGYGGGYSCLGCYGGCFGSPYGCHGGYGCYGGCTGCYGGYGGVAPPAFYTPGTTMPPAGSPAAPAGEPPPVKKDDIKKNGDKQDEGKKEGMGATRAKLVVDLPADAKLYIDDQLMKTPAARRVFSTPTLEPGQAYYYELRAEVVREGKTMTETKRVIVSAGREVPVAFTELAPAKADVAASR